MTFPVLQMILCDTKVFGKGVHSHAQLFSGVDDGLRLISCVYSRNRQIYANAEFGHARDSAGGGGSEGLKRGEKIP